MLRNYWSHRRTLLPNDSLRARVAETIEFNAQQPKNAILTTLTRDTIETVLDPVQYNKYIR